MHVRSRQGMREGPPAALVVLALIVQASGFGFAFRVLSIGLSAAILILGTLTGVRVHNASSPFAR